MSWSDNKELYSGVDAINWNSKKKKKKKKKKNRGWSQDRIGGFDLRPYETLGTT